MSEQAEGQLTEEDAAAFVTALSSFRDGLPPRQREVFSALVLAGVRAPNDDVQGYFFRSLGFAPEQWLKQVEEDLIMVFDESLSPAQRARS